MRAHVRLRLLDYDGVVEISQIPLGGVELAPGETRIQGEILPMPARGHVLATAEALAEDGITLLGSSVQPLSTLPFPKAADRPDAGARGSKPAWRTYDHHGATNRVPLGPLGSHGLATAAALAELALPL